MSHALFDLALFGNSREQSKSIWTLFEETFAPVLSLYNKNMTLDSAVKDEFINGHLMSLSRSMHFVDYPANYYAYPMADRLARQCWKSSFGAAADKLDYKQFREHMRLCGKALYDEVLAKGSAYPAKECLAAFAQKFDTDSEANDSFDLKMLFAETVPTDSTTNLKDATS